MSASLKRKYVMNIRMQELVFRTCVIQTMGICNIHFIKCKLYSNICTIHIHKWIGVSPDVFIQSAFEYIIIYTNIIYIQTNNVYIWDWIGLEEVSRKMCFYKVCSNTLYILYTLYIVYHIFKHIMHIYENELVLRRCPARCVRTN